MGLRVMSKVGPTELSKMRPRPLYFSLNKMLTLVECNITDMDLMFVKYRIIVTNVDILVSTMIPADYTSYKHGCGNLRDVLIRRYFEGQGAAVPAASGPEGRRPGPNREARELTSTSTNYF